MEKHGYKPNLFARALAGGKTGHIGVLTSNISSGFFAEVIRGIDIAAGRNQGHLVVSIAHGIDDYYRLFDELRTSGQVDGVIIIDPPLDLFKRPLPAGHLPLVLCACSAPANAHAWRKVDSVTVDNSGVMAQLVQHLTESGLNRLVHLAGPKTNFDAQQRRQAFAKACHMAKITSSCRILDGYLIQYDGREVIRKQFNNPKTRPDAFVAFNDSVALGVLAELKQDAHRVAVTGWDNLPATEILGITSVEMPLTRLGETSTRLLVERIDNAASLKEPGRAVILEAKLKLRASSQIGVPQKVSIAPS